MLHLPSISITITFLHCSNVGIFYPSDGFEDIGHCLCNEFAAVCRDNGTCSPETEYFGCLVTRDLNPNTGEYLFYQQCVTNLVDYGIFCRESLGFPPITVSGSFYVA